MDNETRINDSILEQTRTCSKCGKNKPLNAKYFANNQSTNTGGKKYFRPECKECHTKNSSGRLKSRKLAGNPKRPALGTACDNPSCKRTNQKLCFDHDPETLKHRGWLCDNCNRSIGMLGDTFFNLLEVIFYLAKSEGISQEDFFKIVGERYK